MRAAVPKSQEIAEELTEALSQGITLHDMSLRRYLQDIDKLSQVDRSEKSYLTALAYGAAGKVREAASFFEASLIFPDEIRANNYLSFIADKGSLVEYKNLLFRLARDYNIRKFSSLAYDLSLYFGEVSNMKEFSAKYCKLSNAEQLLEKEEHFRGSVELIEYFKSQTGLSEEDFSLLGHSAFVVMDKYGYKPASVSFMTLSEQQANSYIVGINSDDAEDIAEMNIDLAFELADHEEFLDKQLSAWFSGSPKKLEHHNDCVK